MKDFGVVTGVSHFKTLKNDKIASMIDVLPTFFKGFNIIGTIPVKPLTYRVSVMIF